jgi:hypothetical protein
METREFTSKTVGHSADVRELTDHELDGVGGGGRKAGEGQREFLVVTVKEVFVTSWS